LPAGPEPSIETERPPPAAYAPPPAAGSSSLEGVDTPLPPPRAQPAAAAVATAVTNGRSGHSEGASALGQPVGGPQDAAEPARTRIRARRPLTPAGGARPSTATTNRLAADGAVAASPDEERRDATARPPSLSTAHDGAALPAQEASVAPARMDGRGAAAPRTGAVGDPAVGGDAAASAARLGVGVGGDLPGAEGLTDAIADEDRHFINRELSTLDFNSRVLALAEQPHSPLLERIKFVAIYSSNMDEFFQVRVAGLKDQIAAGVPGTAPDGLSATDQLTAIRAETTALVERRRRVFAEDLVPALAEQGVRLVGVDDLGAEDRAWLSGMFEDQIFPVLTPLAVDPGHPFPYISNLSLNLAVIVRDPTGGERRFARLKVPPLLPGLVAMPDRRRFLPLEQVIAAHLDALFPGMEIESHHFFRVTRNADLTLEEDEADDLLAAVEMELRRRRFGRAVRLEVDGTISDEVRLLLTRELDLTPEDVYDVDGMLDLGALWVLLDLDRPDLKEEPFTPVTPPRLATADDEPLDLFAAIRRGDLMVHHPYDSFASSVEAFISQAAIDPKVLTIKQTLYRTSGDSPIIRALIRAAERGKQVAALVELKARGDEAANIGWARQLEEAGVHVVYGLVGLKTHSKTALVVRQEGSGVRRYCHIGTGNYNPATARLYEDIGILTCAPELGEDLTDLFNYLTGYSRRVEYRRLLVAPATLRPRVLELIAREKEMGERGRIVWKLNNLVDQKVIEALYDASAAGVQIDLVTRAICCLRPQVPGLSDNIRVRSVVGRWLEHSRVFYFGAGTAALARSGGPVTFDGTGQPIIPRSLPEGGEVYLGSADMMERNLDRRVEAVVSVTEPSLAGRLRHVLDVLLADDVLSWVLSGDGTWHKVPVTAGFSSHRYFQEAALDRSRQRREPEALQIPQQSGAVIPGGPRR
jgi:polyphosphate kinase